MSDLRYVAIPRFGARKVALEIQQGLAVAMKTLEDLGAMDHVAIQRAVDDQKSVLADLERRCKESEQQLEVLQGQIVATTDLAMLQEVGLYEYSHPLTDAASYQTQLKQLQSRIKEMARADGNAVQVDTNWSVDGSLAKGRKLAKDTGKLMLRAYNAEADNLVRGLKPYKLDAATARLEKVVQTISRLGRSMDIQISHSYHSLRLEELELTADFLAKKAEEQEILKAERERLREEAKAQQEMKRERERLEKEQAHYKTALAKLQASGSPEAETAPLELKISDLEKSIEGVNDRAANIRTGWVYVISNIGTFGEDVVKIGLTRRLDPKERVHELGDASVPFRYDLQCLVFDQDAVSLERELHKRMSHKRINLVNMRREFFRGTPAEVREHMVALGCTMVEFQELPEALEYRQSLTILKEQVAISEQSPAEVTSPPQEG